MPRQDFDVDTYLAAPRVGRVAAHGPSVIPVWFLWEESVFWWLTGPWSRLADRLAIDPAVALVVDSCDLASGEVRQVRARGQAEVVAYDRERAYRKLSRYLGDDPSSWDADRFSLEDPATTETRFVRLAPERLSAVDLSFSPSC